MGSTGEPDRKRRHFSPVSATAAAAAAAARKQPGFPCSDEKKLDVAVLQFQNQKLTQQLEAQKVEFFALENKFQQLKEKQMNHNDTLAVVNTYWDRLVGDLESQSVSSGGCTDNGNGLRSSYTPDDGASCSLEDDCLDRLVERGATESCSDNVSPGQVQNATQTNRSKTKYIFENILSSVNCMWHTSDEVFVALLATLPEDESGRQLQKSSNDVQQEVRTLVVTLGELHLKHRQLTDKVQLFRDNDAKSKTEHKLLSVELASAVADLEESNRKLATLKAQKDVAKGLPLPFPSLGNKHGGPDKMRDKQKEVKDLESTLKDLANLISCRLVELQSVHEERLDILRKLASFQNALLDIKSISSTRLFQLLSDQRVKSKAEMDQCWALLEKLQIEKDNFIWHEREASMEVELADGHRRVCDFLESRRDELDQQVKRYADERVLLESRLEAALREPGMNEILVEFKELLLSLPKHNGNMQSELCKYKETAAELNRLRAEVQSLSSILVRKAKEMESLSGRSAQQLDEIKKLDAAVRVIREGHQELKLFLEMYRRESTDTWDVVESRDLEFTAWAQVQTLTTSLDEHSLELRVKAANEAEAISQQQLATAEAEIAELRQKLDVSGRNIRKLSETLKSKHEEGETYLSEIESIGQAYVEMSTQNQHLLQQITERDDYNTKLVMDGVKARLLESGLSSKIETLDKEIKHATSLMDFYSQKVARLDDQLRLWSEHVEKLAEEGRHNSAALESTQRRIMDLQREPREFLGESQGRVERSRVGISESLIELEKERFSKKRVEEEFEVTTRKTAQLKGQSEASATLEKLQEEVGEYRAILKCSICHDRQKEVVVAKCYHLFCSQCVQRALGSRHRKCPTCGTGFGPNDVKPIYI